MNTESFIFNTRSWPKDVRLEDVLWGNLCPLILIQESSIEYANRRKEKRDLIRQYRDASGVLLLAWPGQWSTDVFLLVLNDLEGID